MSEIDALIELLQDEDPQIAIIAMEKLLHNPDFINEHLGELQESADPSLRARIHQMESIISRQTSVSEFTRRIKENEIHLWRDLISQICGGTRNTINSGYRTSYCLMHQIRVALLERMPFDYNPVSSSFRVLQHNILKLPSAVPRPLLSGVRNFLYSAYWIFFPCCMSVAQINPAVA